MSKEYIRNCPVCDKELRYAFSSGYSRAVSRNCKCPSCAKLGNRPWNKDTKGLMTAWNKGMPSLMRGKKQPPSAVEKMRAKLKGRTLSIEHRRKIRLGVIKARSKHQKLYPNYSPEACKLFEKINKELKLNGQHAENGGEYLIKELGYWVDYYEPDLNLIIEYDEAHHFNAQGKLRERDKRRQREIEKKLNCIFIRIQAS